jgi:hypothetical protein
MTDTDLARYEMRGGSVRWARMFDEFARGCRGCKARGQQGVRADAPQDVRMEQFLYDDHLGVWSLTIGFALPGEARGYKMVRVSQADKSVLSVKDA